MGDQQDAEEPVIQIDAQGFTDEERERILRVVAEDEFVRLQEKSRLDILKKELRELRNNGVPDDNEESYGRACKRCCAPLGLFVNTGEYCPSCGKKICKLCRVPLEQVDHDSNEKWMCTICSKFREIRAESGAWFYSGSGLPTAKKKKIYGSMLLKRIFKIDRKQDYVIYKDPVWNEIIQDVPIEEIEEDEEDYLIFTPEEGDSGKVHLTFKSNIKQKLDVDKIASNKTDSYDLTSYEMVPSGSGVPSDDMSFRTSSYIQIDNPFYVNTDDSTKKLSSLNPFDENDEDEGPNRNPFENDEEGMTNGAHLNPFENDEEDVDNIFNNFKEVHGIKDVDLDSEHSEDGDAKPLKTFAGEVQINLTYDHQNSVLEVHVQQARDLIPVDANKASTDPYIKVYLKSATDTFGKKKTKTKKNTLCPEFDEVLSFKIDYEQLHTCICSIHILHHSNKNVALGDVDINMQEVLEEGLASESVTPKWYALHTARVNFNQLTSCGDLVISLQYTSFGNQLHLNLIQAKGLKTDEDYVYCKVSLVVSEDDIRRIKSRNVTGGGTNPYWEEDCIFEDISWTELETSYLQISVRGGIKDSVFIAGTRLGLAKSAHLKHDSFGEEVRAWQSMLDRANETQDFCIPLRNNLDSIKQVVHIKPSMEITDMDYGMLKKKKKGPLAALSSKSYLNANADALSLASSGSMLSIYSNAGGQNGNLIITGDILFSITHNTNSNMLSVYIEKAKGIAAVDTKHQNSDPYCKVYVLPDMTKSSKKKTTHRRKTINPDWKETINYSISREELLTKTLQVSIWNHDRLGRNDFLGEVQINVKEYTCNNDLDTDPLLWYTLQEMAPVSVGAAHGMKGELTVGLRCENDVLNVYIKEAKGLYAVDPEKLPSSFIKCYLLPDKSRKGKRKTSVKKKTIAPVWNEKFEYKGVEDVLYSRVLEVSVWEYNTSGHQFLGGLRLGLQQGDEYWHDCFGDEVKIWEDMMNDIGSQAEYTIPLRATMTSKKEQIIQGLPINVNIAEFEGTNERTVEDLEKIVDTVEARIDEPDIENEDVDTISIMSDHSEDGEITLVGEVQIGLIYDYNDGVFEVHVHQAKDLLDGHKGSVDPYVKVYLNSATHTFGKRKTKTKKNTLSPEFDEILTFNVEYQELITCTCNINIWHNESSKKNVQLAEYDINIQELLNNGFSLESLLLQWYPLYSAKLSTKQLTSCGELICNLQYKLPTGIVDDDNPNKGQFHLNIIQAKGLKVKEDNLCCKISLVISQSEVRKMKSKCVSGTSDPYWDEDFIFDSISQNDLEAGYLQISIRGKQNDTVFIAGTRLGLGKSTHPKHDSFGEEVRIWQSMLDHTNEARDFCIPLRNHLKCVKEDRPKETKETSANKEYDILKKKKGPLSALSGKSKSLWNVDNVSLASSGSMLSIYSNAGGQSTSVVITGEILFSLKHDVSSNVFSIHIEKAKDIAAVNAKQQTSDPYCKVYLFPDKLKTSKKKTTHRRKTINPQWDETVKYKISYEELVKKTLQVSLWNHDRFGRNDFLGEVQVNINEYASSNELDMDTPIWHTLQERAPISAGAADETSGELSVGLQFYHGILNVHIKQALGLQTIDSDALPNPFVKCYLLPDKSRKSKRKTAVRKKTIIPVWNEILEYKGLGTDELYSRVLEVTVWDYNSSGHQFLGGLRLGMHHGDEYWHDCLDNEVTIWEEMMTNNGVLTEYTIPLRATMTSKKEQILQELPAVAPLKVFEPHSIPKAENEETIAVMEESRDNVNNEFLSAKFYKDDAIMVAVNEHMTEAGPPMNSSPLTLGMDINMSEEKVLKSEDLPYEVAEEEEDIDVVFKTYEDKTAAEKANIEDKISLHSEDEDVSFAGEVQVGMMFHHNEGVFEVHVHQAKDLLPVNANKGSADPYVKVYLTSATHMFEKKKTKTKKHTLSPEFEEVLTFKVEYQELITCTCNINIWHHESSKKNVQLAECDINIEELLRNGFSLESPLAQWYPLYPPKLSTKQLTSCGELICNLQYKSPADIANPVKGQFHLNIIQAKGLKVKQDDLYCKISLVISQSDIRNMKSRHVSGSTDPYWDEDFIFDSISQKELEAAYLQVSIRGKQKDTVFIAGTRLGLGKSTHPKHDSFGEEIRIWQSLLDHTNEAQDFSIPLRNNLSCVKVDQIQEVKEIAKKEHDVSKKKKGPLSALSAPSKSKKLSNADTISLTSRASSGSMLSIYSNAGGQSASLEISGEVLFSIKHDPSSNVFSIHIEKAKDIAAVNEKQQSSDPYCKVYLFPDKSKTTKKKTTHRKKTVNPKWDETIKYKIGFEELLRKTLQISIWNHDRLGRNDFLGEVQVNMNDYAACNELEADTPMWYTLQEQALISTGAADEKSGELSVGLRFDQNVLDVHIKQGNGLQVSDPDVLPNTFVKCYLLPDESRKGKRKTSVQKKTTTPVWNEKFDFKGLQLDELYSRVLQVTVWDYNTSSHQFIGGVRLGLPHGDEYWHDCFEKEVTIWEEAMKNEGKLVEYSIPLRATMTSRRGEITDKLPIVSPNIWNNASIDSGPPEILTIDQSAHESILVKELKENGSDIDKHKDDDDVHRTLSSVCEETDVSGDKFSHRTKEINVEEHSFHHVDKLPINPPAPVIEEGNEKNDHVVNRNVEEDEVENISDIFKEIQDEEDEKGIEKIDVVVNRDNRDIEVEQEEDVDEMFNKFTEIKGADGVLKPLLNYNESITSLSPQCSVSGPSIRISLQYIDPPEIDDSKQKKKKPKGALRVRLKEGTHLPIKNIENLPNTFCKVFLYPKKKSSQLKTEMYLKSACPIWDADMTFDGVTLDELQSRALEIIVYDQISEKKKESMGFVRLGSGQFAEKWDDSTGVEVDIWKSMLDNSTHSGFIDIPLRVTLEYETMSASDNSLDNERLLQLHVTGNGEHVLASEESIIDSSQGFANEHGDTLKQDSVITTIVEMAPKNDFEDVQTKEIMDKDASKKKKGPLSAFSSKSKSNMLSNADTMSLASSGSMLSIYSSAGGNSTSLVITGDILFSLKHDANSNVFSVHIEKAKGIAAVHAKQQTSDPYCKVYLFPDKSKTSKKKTTHRRNTINPQWNENVKYNISREELLKKTLQVSIWNHDRFGRNDFLGEVQLHMKQYASNNDLDADPAVWYTLQEAAPIGVGGAGEGNGTLKVGIRHANDLLNVHIKQAKNLIRLDPDVLPNPFVKCYLLPDKSRKGKRKTAVQKKTLSPTWNQKFDFKGVGLDDLYSRVLEVTIWDYNTSGHQFLGGLRLGLPHGDEYWHDCFDDEVSIWDAAMKQMGILAEYTIPLRNTMTSRKGQNTQELPKIASITELPTVASIAEEHTIAPTMELPTVVSIEEEPTFAPVTELHTVAPIAEVPAISSIVKEDKPKPSVFLEVPPGEPFIRVSLQYVEPADVTDDKKKKKKHKGTLKVHLKEASNLPKKHGEHGPNTFCEVFLHPKKKGSKMKSETYRNSTSPMWDSQVMFEGVTVDELRTTALEIVVYDAITDKKKEIIGYVRLGSRVVVEKYEGSTGNEVKSWVCMLVNHADTVEVAIPLRMSGNYAACSTSEDNDNDKRLDILRIIEDEEMNVTVEEDVNCSPDIVMHGNEYSVDSSIATESVSNKLPGVDDNLIANQLNVAVDKSRETANERNDSLSYKPTLELSTGDIRIRNEANTNDINISLTETNEGKFSVDSVNEQAASNTFSMTVDGPAKENAETEETESLVSDDSEDEDGRPLTKMSGELQVGFMYDRNKKVFEVQVHKAKDLLPASANKDTVNPYVKVRVSSPTQPIVKKKTKTKKNCLSPEFDEVLTFKVDYESLVACTCHISVWHDAFSSNNVQLGEFEVNIEEFLSTGGSLESAIPHWYSLSARNQNLSQVVPCGELVINLQYNSSDVAETNPSNGQFHINLIQAKSLKTKVDNLYCKLSLVLSETDSRKLKSRYVTGTEDPYWDEDYVINDISWTQLLASYLQICIRGRNQKDSVFIAGMRLGLGKSTHPKHDSFGEEVKAWQSMLDHANKAQDFCIPLRNHLGSLKQDREQEDRSKEDQAKEVKISHPKQIEEIADEEFDTFDMKKKVGRLSALSPPSKSKMLLNADALSLASSGSMLSIYSNAGGQSRNLVITGDILFSIKHDISSNVFTVYIEKAKAIAAVNAKQHYSDPYCKLYLFPDKTKTTKKKTTHRRKTVDPQWKETIKYNIKREELLTKTLQVSIWNHDRLGRNDFLGEVQVNIKEYTSSNRLDESPLVWYTLQEMAPISVGAADETKGELTVGLRFDRDVLNVHIKQGKGLNAVDPEKLPSSFVKCFLLPDKSRKGKRKTTIQKKTISPVWNEKFDYKGVGIDDLYSRVLEVTVWDYNTSGHQFLGGMHLGLPHGDEYWHDCFGKEVTIWESMMKHSGILAEYSIPLRATMTSRKGQNTQECTVNEPIMEEPAVHMKEYSTEAPSIHISLQYMEPDEAGDTKKKKKKTKGQLKVHLREASNLPKVHGNEDPVTFCKSFIHPKKKSIELKTEAYVKSSDPLWNTELYFEGVTLDELRTRALEIIVYNKISDKKKEVLGYVRLGAGQNVEKWDDSTGVEVMLWTAMLNNPSQPALNVVPLRINEEYLPEVE